MSRTRIKICGLKTVDAALAAVRAGADAVGLVFVPASPRRVSVDEAKRIASALPAFVEPVGLFVDTPAEEVLSVAGRVGLRTVQLQGREGIGVVRQLSSLRVVKALGFDPARAHKDVEFWRKSPGNVVGLQWDAPPSVAAELTGGSGRSFDWGALAALRDEPGYDELPATILAGGLTPENVAEAVAITQPYAVDVSSGVESSRGVKDLGKIVAFCEAVRAADAGR